MRVLRLAVALVLIAAGSAHADPIRCRGDIVKASAKHAQAAAKVLRKCADRVLAGSTVTMIEAVRNLVALGAPLAGALAAATEVPARIARRDDVGRLAPGATADLVVLDDRLELERVLAGGEDVL